MDQIISKILDIDRRAQKKIDTANKKKAEALREIEAERAALVQTLEEKSKEKLKLVSDTENAYADQKIAATQSARDAAIARMEKLYADHHDEWVDALYERVLNDA